MSATDKKRQRINRADAFGFGVDKYTPALRVKKLSDDATLPRRTSEHAAGYDLYSGEQCTIAAHTRRAVATNIAVAVHDPHPQVRHYCRIAPRSSLAAKNCVDVGAGVVDADYRGNVRVLLINNGELPFAVKKGDRIAQLIIERAMLYGVEEVDELDETARGEGGFGSTGLRDD